MATIWSNQQVTGSTSVDSAKSFIYVNRASDSSLTLTLPDLGGLPVGQYFNIYVMDSYTSPVTISTFSGSQLISGTDTSYQLGNFLTITLTAISGTFWALRE